MHINVNLPAFQFLNLTAQFVELVDPTYICNDKNYTYFHQ